MKKITLLSALLLSLNAFAQKGIEWSPEYQLQLSDFKSPSTELSGADVYGLQTGGSLHFMYKMTNAEFMFTKNFNSKIDNTFRPESAVITAPDTASAMKLLHFAQYAFDLSELYARKLRKRIYEEKGTFSDAGFFKPIYEEIESEMSIRYAAASKASKLGQDESVVKDLHDVVLKEIAELSDFCKTCKPNKKKK